MPALRRTAAAGSRAAQAALTAGDTEPEALALLDGLIGGDGVRSCRAERLRVWGQAVGRHWVVPAWFLAVVERLRPGALVLRLLPDQDEADELARVAREVTRAAGVPGEPT